MNEKYRKYYITLLCIQKLGICNMFGSAEYLRKVHNELSKKESSEILVNFMENYNEIFDKYFKDAWYSDITFGKIKNILK